jgi:peptide/nickel transport system permease protein
MRKFAAAFLGRPMALLGLLVFAAIVVIALAAPLLFALGPFTIVGMPLLPPGAPGLLAGSDVLGRDVAVGLAYGARISLLVGIASTLGAAGIGVLLGAIAGYYGGVIDDLLMRVTEFFQIIPSFVLLMVLVAFLQPSLGSTVIGIALISWPQVARVVRGEFLSLRSREFVQAARTLGMRDAAIIFTQILPNALPPIVVVSSMMVGSAILTESALSFLGLGDPNLLSWGSMIGGSRSAMWVAWWTTVLPGLSIMVTVLALNFIGDGLNDALNPRRGR